jgi:cytochrome P450
MADASGAAFRPPTPPLRGETIVAQPFPIGLFTYFRAMARNPLETWGPRAFRTPIIPVEFLGRNYVIINDPQAVRHCYVTNAANYRLNYLRLKMLKPGLREGLLVAEGESWRVTRRALTPIFTPRHVAGFAPAMRAAAERARDGLAAKAGAIVSLRDEMLVLALDVLIACLFSDETSFNRRRFSRTVSDLLDKGGTPHAFDLMRMPDGVPRFGRGALAGIIDSLREQVRAILDRRRVSGATPEDADFLSLLMNARTESGAPLGDEAIVDQLITFLTAGHETTARALAWALYALSEAPDAAARVEAELAAADLSGDPAGWPERLPFLEAVIKETLRLYPPAPHLAREAIGPDKVGDTPIAPGTEVHLSPWLLHRQETLWRDAGVFDPMRFLGEEGAKIDRFAFLPFGVGPRVCIGASFSMLEMTIVLATLLGALRFRHVGAAPPVPVLRITLQPSTPMETLIERRVA